MTSSALVPTDTDARPGARAALAGVVDGFFGREGELEAAAEVLAAPGGVLFITGPGGIGKSRFALELAGRRADAHLEVRSADLSETSTAEGLFDALAVLLDVPRSSDALPTEDAFDRALADAPPTLLVLDSPEHVRDDLAAALRRWVPRAPQLRWLVGSRVAPDLRGARRIELGPLDTADARALFLDRVRAQRWDFAVRPDDEATLTSLLAGLDGVPLALELAASRVPALGLPALHARLGSHLDLLRNRRPGALPRHLTLRATVDWSLALLPADARAALVRSAAFRGSFDLDAFEAVVVPDGTPTGALDVLDTLLDHSLVRAFDGREGRRRFRLYEVVRERAAETLATQSDAAPTFRRHAVHFVERFAATTTPNGPTYLLGLREHEGALLDDVDNLVAGFERMEGIDAALRARSGLQAARVLFRRGATEVLWQLLDRSLEAASRAGDDALRSRLLLARACAERARHKRDVSALLAEATDLADTAGDEALHGAVAWHRALAASDRYDCDGALAQLERALPRLRAHGDRDGELFVHVLRAVALARSGRGHEAIAACREAVAAARSAGHAHSLASALRNLAVLQIRAGAYAEAHVHARESLAVQRSLGDAWSEIMTRVVLCAAAAAAGELDEARTHGEAARRLVARTGFVRPLSYPAEELGWVARAAGDDAAALALFERSLAEGGARGHGLQRAASLSGRAACRLIAGATAEARADLLEALSIKARVPLTVHEAQVDEALLALSHALEGDRAGAQAWTEITREHLARWPHRNAEEVLEVVDALLADTEAPPEPRAGLSPPGRAARHARHRHRARETCPEAALTVGPELRWLALPGGKRMPLARRPVARRIVAALVDARRRTPGEPLEAHVLVARVWPDDRSRKEDLANRLWVAVSGLRRAGLGPLLKTDDAGYLLDPEVPLVDARPAESA
ncbi:MAG: tetratricopeptide repeat protein [Myxococcota bacterium]